MMLKKESDEAVLAGPPLLGDHLAMDLLNTEASVEGRMVDYWQSADDVLAWLERNGIRPASDGGAVDGAVLLASAVRLRAIARGLIEQRKAGDLVDPNALNVYLHGYLSAPHLERDGEGRLVLTRRGDERDGGYLLGAVAEAVAQLLVDGQFSLVRQCEHPECVLWFYDRTKSHKRRWCSMALCGNRHKAAQFRKRNADAHNA